MSIRFIGLLTLAVSLLCSLSLSAQPINPADSTGLPGDNFSLEGALELFKQAASPEDFEKLLNTESNGVNNLDLNEDGEVDYIRVIDNMEGDVHAIVLQAPVSADESQDIAVIEIEKQGTELAILQIVGDEDIFGEQVIVEPFEEEADRSGRGPSAGEGATYRVVVNVWVWPSVRFIYRPAYTVWVSPFYWAYYPAWWRSWRPYPWRAFHVRHVHYRTHYHLVTTHRVVRAHQIYTPRRKSSTVVHTRTTTVVAGRRGNVKAARTTTTTRVNGNSGNINATRTTTRAGVQTNDGRVTGARTTTRTGVNTRQGTVTRKTTTTRAAKAGANGRVAGSRTTTTVRRKRN